MNLDEQFPRDSDKVDGRWLAFVFTVVVLAVAAFYVHHAADGIHASSTAGERLVIKGGT